MIYRGEQTLAHALIGLGVVLIAGGLGFDVAAQAYGVGIYVLLREAEDYLANRDMTDALRDAAELVGGGVIGVLLLLLL